MKQNRLLKKSVGWRKNKLAFSIYTKAPGIPQDLVQDIIDVINIDAQYGIDVFTSTGLYFKACENQFSKTQVGYVETIYYGEFGPISVPALDPTKEQACIGQLPDGKNMINIFMPSRKGDIPYAN